MEYLNLAPLDKDGSSQYVIAAVPSQHYSVRMGMPVQTTYDTQDGWNTQKTINILPNRAPTQSVKILSNTIIRPARTEHLLISENGSQLIKNVHNVPDKRAPVKKVNVVQDPLQSLLKPNQMPQKPNISKRKQTIPSFSNPPIHILKSGETYQSLDNLDDEKLKLVTSALKSIGNPIKSKKKVVYDGATKTRIKYKVIYPKDLNISGASEITLKGAVPRRDSETNIATTQPASQTTEEQANINTITSTKNEEPLKVTRSGRAVKSPKGRGPQDDLGTPKRKQKLVNMLTCLRCRDRFSGVSKINRHYEQFPAHKPNTTHSNLFKCFLDIMRKCPREAKGSAFVEQLEELIVRIRSMLPCMINNIDCNYGKLCCINEDLGRMLDMEPGKYNISVDEAVHCYENGKDKCKHIVRGNTLGCNDLNKPSQLWVAKHNEEIAMMSSEETDCARTHSVDKWPVIKKRIKKYIPITTVKDTVCQNTPNNEHAITTVIPDTQVTNIWIVPKDTNTVSLASNKVILTVPETVSPPVLNVDVKQMNAENFNMNILPHQGNDDVITVPKTTTYQYHSSHFDIRSSPIKPSTNTYNKILIKGDNFPSFVKLADEERTNTKNDTKASSTDMHIDINGMFSELHNRVLDKEEPKPEQTRPNNEFYRTPPTDLSASVNLGALRAEIPKEYAMQASDSSNFCNISQSSRCQNDRLLSSGNTQMPRSEALAGLCANENNLDSSRMGMQLLDHLGNDCLSFTDTELRNASLDLPLDLFPFNNAE